MDVKFSNKQIYIKIVLRLACIVLHWSLLEENENYLFASPFYLFLLTTPHIMVKWWKLLWSTISFKSSSSRLSTNTNAYMQSVLGLLDVHTCHVFPNQIRYWQIWLSWRKHMYFMLWCDKDNESEGPVLAGKIYCQYQNVILTLVKCTYSRFQKWKHVHD